jgi:hypothetical protein
MAEPGTPTPQPPKPVLRSTTAGPALALPRRRPSTRAPFPEAAAANREAINNIVEATRASLQRSPALPPEQIAELERSLRQLELSLNERQRLVTESEVRLAERERDVAEMEALLVAREKLLAVSPRRTTASPVPVSADERAALELLRDTLAQQEANLKEAKQALREREQFLDESEAKLFAKVQAQQEKESELEQREEDLRARQRRDRETRAAFDPKAAEELEAEKAAAKKRDEFNE